MICREQGSTWPFGCVLTCLVALGVTSLRAGAQTDQTAAESDGDPVPSAKKAPPLSWVSEIQFPEEPASGSEPPPRPPSGRPSDEAAGRPKDRDAARPQTGAQTESAYRVAPHDEVVLPPGGPAAIGQPPPLLAKRPSPVSLRTGGTTARSRESVSPDAVPLPPDRTPAGRSDQAPSPGGRFAWVEPDELLARLDELADESATGKWAKEVERLVRQLGSAVSHAPDDAVSIVGQLEELAAGATLTAAGLDDRPLARKLCRTGYALKRRLDVWSQAVQIAGRGAILADVPPPDPKRLSLCLADIDEVTGESAQGRAWRQYLLIDTLREWSAGDGASKDRLPTTVARAVLKRMSQIPVTTPQRQFLASQPVAALQEELRLWAAEPVELARLLDHLERYEKTGSGSDARLLATDCVHLGLQSGQQRRRLAGRLEANYRNANLRVTVTEDLLDRLMPEQEPEYAQVRETMLGKPVSGQSVTSSKVSLRMVPDPNRVRLALQITGQVASLTSSTRGPATFYNDSTSTYTVRKPLEIDLEGIRVLPAQVEVRGDTRLRRLRTDFDGVPLLGGLVQEIARSQQSQRRDEILCELKQKVAMKARRRIDAEADARVDQISQAMHQRVLDPLESLRLDPTIISAETIDRRLTIRLRLAGEDQLGGHTPRPRAPADSLASFQVHETAINNMVERLALDGRTFTLPELSRHVSTQLNRPPLWEADPTHEDVTLTFAEQDAVSVRLQHGQVVLNLSIAELSRSSRRWKDFTAHVCYRPHVSGQSARLIRDGVVRLSGEPRGTGAQIALRGIFSKTFSRRSSWSLTPERLSTDPKLADLAVTQFAIEDGWIGVALGPQQTAQRGTLRR